MRADVPDRQCSFALPAAAAELGGEWEGMSCRGFWLQLQRAHVRFPADVHLASALPVPSTAPARAGCWSSRGVAEQGLKQLPSTGLGCEGEENLL